MSSPKPYVPENAKINIKNDEMNPPTTLYERTRHIFDRNVVNDIVKGNYGATDKSDTTSGL